MNATPAATESAKPQAIVPTVGRVVHYWPKSREAIDFIADQPLRADVCGVEQVRIGHNLEYRVHLNVSGCYGGVSQSRRHVPIFNPDDVTEAVKLEGGYATWMPFQVGQAAKTQDDSARLSNLIEVAMAAVTKRQDELLEQLEAQRQHDIDARTGIEQRITKLEQSVTADVSDTAAKPPTKSEAKRIAEQSKPADKPAEAK